MLVERRENLILQISYNSYFTPRGRACKRQFYAKNDQKCARKLREADTCPEDGNIVQWKKRMRGARNAPRRDFLKERFEMKRILAIMLAAAIAVSLCACGAKQEKTPTYEDYVSSGSTALEKKDYDTAQKDFSDAVSLDSKKTEAYFGLYESYMGLEDAESAKQALNDGISATDNADMKRILTTLNDPDAESGATEESSSSSGK